MRMLRRRFHNATQRLSDGTDDAGVMTFGTYGGSSGDPSGFGYSDDVETNYGTTYKRQPVYANEEETEQAPVIVPNPVFYSNDVVDSPVTLPNQPVNNDIVYSSNPIVGQVIPNIQTMDESGNLHAVVVDTKGNIIEATPEQIQASSDAGVIDALSLTDAPADLSKTSDASLNPIEAVKSLLGISSNANGPELTTEKKTILLATGIAAIGILALMFKK